MAITWDVKTEIVNANTDLRKIVAIRTDDVADIAHVFFVKGCMKSPEEQKKIWDNIWAQWIAIKAKAVDAIAVVIQNNLEEREIL